MVVHFYNPIAVGGGNRRISGLLAVSLAPASVRDPVTRQCRKSKEVGDLMSPLGLHKHLRTHIHVTESLEQFLSVWLYQQLVHIYIHFLPFISF